MFSILVRLLVSFCGKHKLVETKTFYCSIFANARHLVIFKGCKKCFSLGCLTRTDKVACIANVFRGRISGCGNLKWEKQGELVNCVLTSKKALHVR